MDKMSIQDLQHAATAPYRFMDLVKFPGYLTPFQTREHLQRVPPWSVWLDQDVVFKTHNFCLIPGGRFLIASWESQLILWDLGYSSKQYLNPYPLAVGEHRGDLIAASPTMNGEELIVAAIVG